VVSKGMKRNTKEQGNLQQETSESAKVTQNK